MQPVTFLGHSDAGNPRPALSDFSGSEVLKFSSAHRRYVHCFNQICNGRGGRKQREQIEIAEWGGLQQHIASVQKA